MNIIGFDPSFFQTNFSIADWIIVGVYITLIALLGVLVSKFISSSASFMVGGRASRLGLNTASLIGTELGLVTIMYASNDGFVMGFAFLIVPLMAFVIYFILGASGFVIEKLRERKLVTISEFFHKRFSKRTRIIAGIITALAGILNMGLFPKMGAIFVTYATGLGSSEDSEMIVNLIMSTMIVLVVVYTVFSGMVAVLILDYIQFTILSIGLLVGLYFSLSGPESGWTDMISSYSASKGEAAFNPFMSGNPGWLYVIFNFLVIFASGISWMPAVSRSLTAKNPKVAKRTFLFGSPGLFIRIAIPAFFAFGAYAYFSAHPEFASYFFNTDGSLISGHTSHAMPLFMAKLLPAGFIGVLTAGLLAAFMSTHDSYFMSWSAVISRDVVKQVRKKPSTDKQEIKWARISILCMGVFLIIWGLWFEMPDRIWDYMAITGTIYFAGASVTLIGGLYWKKASTAGAIAALCGGIIAFPGIFQEQIQPHWPWFDKYLIGIITFVFCTTLLITFSLLFPDKKKPELIKE